MNYIIEQIHVHKKLMSILTSGWLYCGRTTICTFSDIYMLKIENDVIILSKPIIYCIGAHPAGASRGSRPLSFFHTVEIVPSNS